MHVANVTVNKDWVNLEDLISEVKGEAFTFNVESNYYLVNCGGLPVLFLNTAEKPEDTITKGLEVESKEQCGLKLTSGKVFARCLQGSTDLHVEVEG